MPYAYPSPKTGTAQDLLRIVTRAYELELERSGTVLPVKTDAQRRWVEPVFRAAGVVMAKLMELMPAEFSVAFHDRLFAALSAPHSYRFDPENPVLLRARKLAARLEAETGLAPALLALISHPPVLGDLAHMNLELVRHATLALRGTRGRPCRPRMVAATDPFALDSISIWEEGLYAGYMGTFHVGVDRLALGGRPGPALTPLAAWSAMPQRLLAALARGGEIGLVLAGGVPATGRVLYAAREWIRGARRSSPLRGRPGEVSARLDADSSFARFETTLARSVFVPPGTWRVIDAWLMAAAAGLLPGETLEAAAAAALECLAVPAAERPALLADLARSASRETPFRRRLFRLLAGRVARRRPIVLIPVIHGENPRGIALREAWGWEWLGPGRVRARRADDPGTSVETTTDAFADRFVEENFA
ncbi:MAG: hypothetical protein KGJ84_04790 [Elusimicrobia bacterium]|nr:hypothetical protein [Elusimicrobiota bacterium]